MERLLIVLCGAAIAAAGCKPGADSADEENATAQAIEQPASPEREDPAQPASDDIVVGLGNPPEEKVAQQPVPAPVPVEPLSPRVPDFEGLPSVEQVLQENQGADPKDTAERQAAAFSVLDDFIEIATGLSLFQVDQMPPVARDMWRLYREARGQAIRSGLSSLGVDRYWHSNDFRKEVIARLPPENQEIYWSVRSTRMFGQDPPAPQEPEPSLAPEDARAPAPTRVADDGRYDDQKQLASSGSSSGSWVDAIGLCNNPLGPPEKIGGFWCMPSGKSFTGEFECNKERADRVMCRGGGWVDAIGLCNNPLGPPEKIGSYWCITSGKSFTGEFECNKERADRVKCTGGTSSGSGGWVDAPSLCNNPLGPPEKIGSYWCITSGKSFTGEFECNKERADRVKCTGGTSGGSGAWVDAPSLCNNPLGPPEKIGGFWCMPSGKSFTGEFECNKERADRVMCK